MKDLGVAFLIAGTIVALIFAVLLMNDFLEEAPTPPQINTGFAVPCKETSLGNYECGPGKPLFIGGEPYTIEEGEDDEDITLTPGGLD